jgi:hypothetical protein
MCPRENKRNKLYDTCSLSVNQKNKKDMLHNTCSFRCQSSNLNLVLKQLKLGHKNLQLILNEPKPLDYYIPKNSDL